MDSVADIFTEAGTSYPFGPPELTLIFVGVHFVHGFVFVFSFKVCVMFRLVRVLGTDVSVDFFV